MAMVDVDGQCYSEGLQPTQIPSEAHPNRAATNNNKWRRRVWTVGGLATQVGSRGAVGLGRGGTASPTFFDRGTRPPFPPLFWTEIRAKVSPL